MRWVDMTMTSEPAIYVPFWGSNVKMGEVVFRVRSAPGASSCMVSPFRGLHGCSPCPVKIGEAVFRVRSASGCMVSRPCGCTAQTARVPM